MRSILMIVTTLVLVGCNNTDGGGGSSETTTLTQKESSIIAPPGEELKAKGYNNEYIQMPNTATIDYSLYRRHWNRVNNRLTYENKHNPVKPVELNLSDLSFRDAFNIEYCAKGAGHTFWWKGREYTTNLLTDQTEYPSVDKE